MHWRGGIRLHQRRGMVGKADQRTPSAVFFAVLDSRRPQMRSWRMESPTMQQKDEKTNEARWLSSSSVCRS